MAEGLLSRRQLAHVVLLGALSLAVPRLARGTPARTRLFVIERSKNKNIVCYDLLHPEGQATHPKLDVYWRMNQEKGQRSELTLFERDRAYGYRIVSEHPLSFALKAAPKRPIEVVTRSGQTSAELTISGVRATLDAVYVKTREGGLIPQVLYVELQGHLPSGALVTERITG
jgi:Domain of unknown function (DUF4833)